MKLSNCFYDTTSNLNSNCILASVKWGQEKGINNVTLVFTKCGHTVWKADFSLRLAAVSLMFFIACVPLNGHMVRCRHTHCVIN